MNTSSGRIAAWAAVIGVVVAIIGIVVAHDDADTGAASAPAPTIATTEPTTSVSVPPPIPRHQQTWAGQVRIGSDMVDLGTTPPAPNNSSAGLNYGQYSFTPNDLNFHSGTPAIWNDGTTPTYDECLVATQTQALSTSEKVRVAYKPGIAFCVLEKYSSDTIANRSTMVFLRSTSKDGKAVEFDVIQWDAGTS